MKKREKSFFEHRGYISYLTSLLLGDGFLRIYRRVWKALRPTLWLRRILRLFVWLVLLIESGVLFLMLSLALLLLVPSVAFLLLVLLPSILRARARICAYLLPRLRGKPLVLLRSARAEGLSARLRRDGYHVLLVGTGRGSLCRARVLKDGCLEIPPLLYFSLRQRLLFCASRVICLEFFENDLANMPPSVL